MNFDYEYTVSSPDLEPATGSEDAAGWDFRSAIDHTLNPGERKLIPTGVKMALPKYTVGLIWPRSKLANKFGISVMGGVIDCDYRGEIMVILHNSGTEPLVINRGDRIAQIIIQGYWPPNATRVEELSSETDRGNSGVNSDDLRIN